MNKDCSNCHWHVDDVLEYCDGEDKICHEYIRAKGLIEECKYCNRSSLLIDKTTCTSDIEYIDNDYYLVIYDEHKHPVYKLINYCPICGRKLVEE